MIRTSLAFGAASLGAGLALLLVANNRRSTTKRTITSEESATASHVTVEHHLRHIQAILKFWFGRYERSEAQKKLWMISNQNDAQRRLVDTEITVQFGSLLEQASNLLEEWVHNPLYGYQGKLAYIVLLDQFSRHVHRFLSYDNSSTAAPLSIPPQNNLDQLAYRAAETLWDVHKDELSYGMVSAPMIIFSLMPFRHQSTIETVTLTQRRTEDLDQLNQSNDSLIKSFRKATNRRLAVLQDEDRRTGNGNRSHDILESDFFVADKTKLKFHLVYSVMQNFVNEYGIKSVVVSLSGGVDSMVIASVLAEMGIETIAVHIDYANRPESGDEAAYVEEYCERIGIKCIVRRIDEVTRGVTARGDYERIARDIRYTLYRDCLNQHPGTNGIMLGHHRGDLRENVLSNAHKGCGPLDLSGMTATSINNGVRLYRPLLTIEKIHIFGYAHAFGVPYFKDTTPHWSTRGKLRNKLLPLLEEIYGEGSMNSLSNLAVESDDCRDLLYKVSIQPFMDGIVYKPMGIYFSTAPFKEQGVFFWKFVLREVLHSMGMGMFSDKAVVSFMERACVESIREGWLQCRKDYAVYLREDGVVFIFYPRSFPWHKKDQYKCKGQRFSLGSTVAVGPWRVSAASVDDSVQDSEQPLKRKSFESLESFMDGSYEYLLGVATRCRGNGELETWPIEFARFTKRTRPVAWKGIDPKIQEILPILGLSSDAWDERDNVTDQLAESSCYVRVSLELERESGTDGNQLPNRK